MSAVSLGSEGTPLVVESWRGLPLVSIFVAFRTGSFFDPVGKEGLARITGRMLRRGTTARSAAALAMAIDRLGAEVTVETSASTVAVFAQVVRRNVWPLVTLLAELLGAPAMEGAELEALRRISIAELASAADDDATLGYRAFRRAMFGGHPFGRPTRGRTATLPSITRDDVVGYYRGHLTRENVVFGFAGDISRDEAARAAEELLAGLPSAPRREIAFGDPPRLEGRALVIVDKPERTQTHVLVGALGSSPHDVDHEALGVAVTVLGGTFSSRLVREVRSKRGWSYAASAYAQVERARHALRLASQPAAKDAAACVALELELLEAWVEDGVSAREVAAAKRHLTRRHAFEIDTPLKRLHLALDVILLSLPLDYQTRYLPSVRAVTAESASRATRARIEPRELAIVVVGAAKDLAPALERAIPDLRAVTIVPYGEDEG